MTSRHVVPTQEFILPLLFSSNAYPGMHTPLKSNYQCCQSDVMSKQCNIKCCTTPITKVSVKSNINLHDSLVLVSKKL